MSQIVDSSLKNESQHNRPLFSLIFLTWNPGEKIFKSLKSVESQNTTDYEVIIVDNNSQDGSIEDLESKYGNDKRFKFVKNKDNLGFAPGMNQGIDISVGEFICCFNQDTILPNGYLQTIKSNLNEDSVWTTNRISYRVSKNIQTLRLMSKYRFTIPYETTGLSGVVDVNFVSGDGIIIPRSILDEIDRKVFDEDLPIRGEDIEFSLFLQDENIQMKAILDTYTVHPDKADMYHPNIQNAVRLINTIRSRYEAHSKRGRKLQSLVAIATVISNPVYIYLFDYPKSEKDFMIRIKS